MKTSRWLSGVAAVLATAGIAVRAGDELTGALIGAALGAAVGASSDHVKTWVSIPVGAAAGALLGHAWERRSSYAWDDDPWAYHRWGHYPPHRVVERVVRVEAPKAKPAPAAPADPHPGVELIKVSILNPNGVRTDVPVLKVGGKFVGPQGETYESLPSSETLAKRYAMPAAKY
jgi:hypothetical protein